MLITAILMSRSGTVVPCVGKEHRQSSLPPLATFVAGSAASENSVSIYNIGG